MTNREPGAMDGRQLAAELWAEVVHPIVRSLNTSIPTDSFGAALLGPGSEVLGFDDERSRDHDFGPRVLVLVARAGRASIPVLEDLLDRLLPERFHGFPVRYPTTIDPVARHRVQVTTVDDLFRVTCGIDRVSQSITSDEWLLAPTQVLRSVTAGAVFADPSGEIAAARAAVAWYPDDVWRYVLACQWRRLAQHEHLAPRAGAVGDDLGSRLLAGSLADDLVHLAFLVERVWAPYPKWLGTAFAELSCAASLLPLVSSMLHGSTWQERQHAYVAAAESLAAAVNGLALVDAIDPTPRPFHDRPFPVIDAGRFADALMASSTLHDRGWRGAIDQWTDNTDVLTERRR